jgi:glyoxylase-like metal-dependent hydrolase (beta-lactamase superfamily II)
MTIGEYTLHSIDTGTFALDGGAMFGVVPKILWERSNPPDAKNRIPLAARALLAVGGGRRVLIDVGNGTKFAEKLAAIYAIDNSGATLEGSLRRYGLAPSDITDVILTHLHFDHAGGSTIRKEGLLQPAFPNATYHVQKEHWHAANNPTERDRASFFPEDFLPLHERGMLRFTSGEGEVLPGISVRIVNGHTTALQCPVLSDGDTTLFYCADLMPTVTHVQLPWIMAYDLRPLVTLEEKRAVLDQAAREHWVLFFEHDPSIAAGRVRITDRGVVFHEPVVL